MKKLPGIGPADTAERYIDLHTHSACSDGTDSPAEIVSLAKETGLSAVSLTDHDTISGLEEARGRAAQLGILFVNGVEINSRCHMDGRDINIHVLGYSFVPDALKDYMDTLKALRTEHNRAILRALAAVGIPIEYEELEAQSPGSTITRLNIARFLVQKGYAETVKDALQRYLHKGGSAFVEFRYPFFCEVAEKIHDAKGVVSCPSRGVWLKRRRGGASDQRAYGMRPGCSRVHPPLAKCRLCPEPYSHCLKISAVIDRRKRFPWEPGRWRRSGERRGPDVYSRELSVPPLRQAGKKAFSV